MTLTSIVFYALAAIMVFAALGVISSRNPVHSVLYLVLAFFAGSGVWLTLRAEFLAMTLVLVYVGAVMVLFLFVVMMLDINFDLLRKKFKSYLPIGALIGVVIALELSYVLAKQLGRVPSMSGSPADAAGYNNTKELGRVLYTIYVYPFEIASVVLLVAIVSAIALTFRRRSKTRYMDPSEQVKVKSRDRVRIVKMDVSEAPADLVADVASPAATTPTKLGA